MADEGKSYNEHDDRVSFPQRRKKGRGPFRWKSSEGNRRSGRGGSGIRSSRLEDDDRDVAMSDAQDVPRVRYNPYAARPNRRGDGWHDRNRIHITVRRDRPPQERGGAGTSQDGTAKNWFKITIPYGRKYDKAWLLSVIQSKCSVPFTPVEFHYENTRAQFFVEDASTASALKAVNYKILDQENRRISIIINASVPPHSVQNELKPEQVEQLKLIMSKRYDGSQQALDLKGLRSDPGSRQRPGQQHLLSCRNKNSFPFLPWTSGKGAAEGKGYVRCLLPSFLPLFSERLLASYFFHFFSAFSFLFLSAPLYRPPNLSLASAPSCLFFLSLLLFLPSLIPLPCFS
uniref:Nuclear RNA export factor 1 n=1 Tax=Equus asinus TaxID=9793 RepID=A0A9L0JMC3_EQUAS